MCYFAIPLYKDIILIWNKRTNTHIKYIKKHKKDQLFCNNLIINTMPRLKIKPSTDQAKRLREMFAYYGESPQILADKLGLRRLNSVDNVYAQKTGISPDLIDKIRKVHKEVNPQYLLDGKGKLILTKEQLELEHFKIDEKDKICLACIEKDKIIEQYQSLEDNFTKRYNTIIDKQEQLIKQQTGIIDQQYKKIEELEKNQMLRKS